MADISKHYVIGIGASAGGLDALQKVFDNIDKGLNSSFIIVQHLSPNFESLMSELLSKHTHLDIYTAKSGMAIKPNTIYLNPKEKNLVVEDGKLKLLERPKNHGLNFPIDLFFHSLGKEFKEQAIGVVLSGTGTDGSRGIKTIKETGGIIMVQDPETAQFNGMPNAAMDTDLVDFMLSPKEISKEIHRIIVTKERFNELDYDGLSEDHMFKILLNHIRKGKGIDFHAYKKNTLIRRLAKRFLATKNKNLSEYFDYIQKNEDEVQLLKSEFLIGVTSFFRNKEAYEILRTEVIPNMFTGEPDPEKPIRIWVAACSTGEEAYSLAILIHEHLRKIGKNYRFKIFATDVDPRAIEKASQGVYSRNSMAEISEEILGKYFNVVGEKYEIVKSVRDNLVFSVHNLLKDPPFIRVDLVTCRNFLIYIENEAQERVLAMFQFALKLHGYLFLGNSETLGPVEKYFDTLNKKWRIYQNISSEKVIPGSIRDQNYRYKALKNKISDLPELQSIRPKRVSAESNFTKYIVDREVKSSLFIDKQNQILYLSGMFEDLVQVRAGVTSLSLENLKYKSLITLIKTSLQKLVEDELTALKISGVKFDKDKDPVDLQFEVVDTLYLSNIYYIEILKSGISEASKIKEVRLEDLTESAKNQIEFLESSLQKSQYELQNVVEEMETSNEELQASNEELMASNEELQSTNEELQSVNEELYTVNTELQFKNRELSELNNDINNLLNSNNIATLFLDKDLCIRKYTPSIGRHFKLQEKDIGRPIEIFASSFNDSDQKTFTSNIKQALNSFKVSEFEIQDIYGNWFLCRTNPFITNNKIINGVVATLTDISKLKNTQADLMDWKNELSSVIDNSPIGISTLNIEGEFLNVNPAFEDFTGQSKLKLNGSHLKEIIHPDSQDAFKEKFEKLIAGKINTYSGQLKFLKGGNKFAWGALTLTFNKKTEGNNNHLIAMVMDTDEIRKKQELIELNESRLRLLFESMSEGFIHAKAVNSNNWVIIDVNNNIELFTGIDRSNLMGKKSAELKNIALFNHEKFLKACFNSANTLQKNSLEIYLPKGKQWVSANIFAPKKGEFAVTLSDITESKKADKAIKVAIEKAERSDRLKSAFLANLSHEIRTPMNSIIGFTHLLKQNNIPDEKRSKYVEIINQQGQILLGLINDLVDISKIEANEIQLMLTTFNLAKVFDQTIEAQRNNFAHKQDLVFKLKVHKSLESKVVEADKNRLVQILNNLLSNAGKFTDSGHIELSCEPISESMLEIQVKDSGIGIPEFEQENIFKRFYQVENQSLATGTGLGLAITKGLVEALGGKIRLESSPGKGSIFNIKLPIKYSKTKTNNGSLVDLTKLKSKLKGKTILIGEDEEDNFILLEQILKQFDVNILHAVDGSEAISLFKANKVDLVLMDIKLPVLNGIDATKAIRSLNAVVPILAQTSYALENERERITKAGCNMVIPKPIEQEVLFKALNEYT